MDSDFETWMDVTESISWHSCALGPNHGTDLRKIESTWFLSIYLGVTAFAALFDLLNLLLH